MAQSDTSHKNLIHGCPCMQPYGKYAGRVPKFVESDFHFALPASCGMDKDVELFLMDTKEDFHSRKFFRKTFHTL